MTQTTGSIPKALWPGIMGWWGAYYDQHPKEYTQIFKIVKSKQAFEEMVQVNGFGLAGVIPENGKVAYDTMTQGYVKRFTPVKRGIATTITEETIEDNLYMKVAEARTRAMAFSIIQTQEITAANVLNRAFNSSYTGGDSKELCATDHPTIGGTQQNELTTAADLSEAALEDLFILIMQAKDQRNLSIKLLPQALIVPPNLYFEAERILKSVNQSGTANNDVNAIRSTGMLPKGIILNHYLTDTDAYFIQTNALDGLMYIDRRPPTMARDNDFDTSNLKMKTTYRSDVGWVDWRNIYGSPGA